MHDRDSDALFIYFFTQSSTTPLTYSLIHPLPFYFVSLSHSFTYLLLFMLIRSIHCSLIHFVTLTYSLIFTYSPYSHLFSYCYLFAESHLFFDSHLLLNNPFTYSIASFPSLIIFSFSWSLLQSFVRSVGLLFLPSSLCLCLSFSFFLFLRDHIY